MNPFIHKTNIFTSYLLCVLYRVRLGNRNAGCKKLKKTRSLPDHVYKTWLHSWTARILCLIPPSISFSSYSHPLPTHSWLGPFPLPLFRHQLNITSADESLRFLAPFSTKICKMDIVHKAPWCSGY